MLGLLHWRKKKKRVIFEQTAVIWSFKHVSFLVNTRGQNSIIYYFAKCQTYEICGFSMVCTLITIDLFSLTIDSNHEAQGSGPMPPVQMKCGEVKFPRNLFSAALLLFSAHGWNWILIGSSVIISLFHHSLVFLFLSFFFLYIINICRPTLTIETFWIF